MRALAALGSVRLDLVEHGLRRDVALQLVHLIVHLGVDAQSLGDLPSRPVRPDDVPTTALLAFDTETLERDWQRALAAGATVVKKPEPKPWQQTVGYLRDPDGIVIELCTPSPRP